MWAQLIKMSVKPGHDQELANVLEQLHATEQADSGLLRSVTMRDQADPSQIYTLVLFESEERARAREGDPRRDEGLANVRALMAELFEGPAEFTNLTVLRDA
jgi:quinol monooxygenase YgiN